MKQTNKSSELQKPNKLNKLNNRLQRPKDVKKMTEAEQAYKRNENFVFRRIENETILVPIKDNVGDMNCIYNLNEVGAFIWQNIKCKHSVTDLKKMIRSEFKVTESQAEADLDEFVNDLKEIEAIIPASSCPNCNCA